MSSSFGICNTITQNGTKCTSPAADYSGMCAHHARIARVMALAPKSTSSPRNAPNGSTTTTTTTTTKINSAVEVKKSGSFKFHEAKREINSIAYSDDGAASRITSSSTYVSTTSTSTSNSSPSSIVAAARWMLQGETLVVSSLNCTFVFPHAIGLESVQGKLYITNYRLRFEPSNSALRMPGAYHYLLDDALIGIPRACVAKLRYPQSNSKQRGQYEGVLYQLQIKFKDLRSWTLEGDINSLMMTLNRAIFVDSPLSLFAFAPGNRVNPHDPRELEGHHIYNIYRDFARMGIDLSSGNSAFRITEINNNYNICPTYPQQFVVPAMMSDSEVTSVAEFRSKGRMPILCYVYRNQAATLWRCAQPKRGIFNAQNLADEQMLGYISYSNPNHNRIWIADCRPEINARVNNLTGGGTESSSIQHATVTFLNIANIHAMRESIEGVRNLTLLTNSDNWMARVEETKWLQHVRLVLSAALRIADTIANKKMTVLVHCSDGWDRTGQLCALSQILLDDHYRTLKGFLEIIEKEWIRVGHKFQDRVGPGNPETEEQSPIFLQFLDCVWQILRLYPTYFEFNAKLLEFIADSLFSARFGTFLGNCDRERNLWDTATRTPSLWTFILSNISNYSNPFYRKPKNGLSLIPPSSSILRQVTLWTEYYFRGASLLSFPHGNPEPPEEGATGNIELSRTCFDDMSDSLSAAKKQIAQLEEQLRLRGSHCDQPVHQSVHQPVHIPTPAPIPSQVPPVLSVPTPTAVHVLPPSASLHVPSTITPTAGSNWTCGICSKLNLSAATKCVVCGRGPSSSTLK